MIFKDNKATIIINDTYSLEFKRDLSNVAEPCISVTVLKDKNPIDGLSAVKTLDGIKLLPMGPGNPDYIVLDTIGQILISLI